MGAFPSFDSESLAEKSTPNDVVFTAFANITAALSAEMTIMPLKC